MFQARRWPALFDMSSVLEHLTIPQLVKAIYSNSLLREKLEEDHFVLFCQLCPDRDTADAMRRELEKPSTNKERGFWLDCSLPVLICNRDEVIFNAPYGQAPNWLGLDSKSTKMAKGILGQSVKNIDYARMELMSFFMAQSWLGSVGARGTKGFFRSSWQIEAARPDSKIDAKKLYLRMKSRGPITAENHALEIKVDARRKVRLVSSVLALAGLSPEDQDGQKNLRIRRKKSSNYSAPASLDLNFDLIPAQKNGALSRLDIISPNSLRGGVLSIPMCQREKLTEHQGLQGKEGGRDSITPYMTNRWSHDSIDAIQQTTVENRNSNDSSDLSGHGSLRRFERLSEIIQSIDDVSRRMTTPVNLRVQASRSASESSKPGATQKEASSYSNLRTWFLDFSSLTMADINETDEVVPVGEFRIRQVELLSGIREWTRTTRVFCSRSCFEHSLIEKYLRRVDKWLSELVGEHGADNATLHPGYLDYQQLERRLQAIKKHTAENLSSTLIRRSLKAHIAESVDAQRGAAQEWLDAQESSQPVLNEFPLAERSFYPQLQLHESEAESFEDLVEDGVLPMLGEATYSLAMGQFPRLCFSKHRSIRFTELDGQRATANPSRAMRRHPLEPELEEVRHSLVYNGSTADFQGLALSSTACVNQLVVGVGGNGADAKLAGFLREHQAQHSSMLRSARAQPLQRPRTNVANRGDSRQQKKRTADTCLFLPRPLDRFFRSRTDEDLHRSKNLSTLARLIKNLNLDLILVYVGAPEKATVQARGGDEWRYSINALVFLDYLLRSIASIQGGRY